MVPIHLYVTLPSNQFGTCTHRPPPPLEVAFGPALALSGAAGGPAARVEAASNGSSLGTVAAPWFACSTGTTTTLFFLLSR
eukprot:COSAG02_NODE_30124_length_556_cov_3.566740_2_plen_81_part_00